MTVRASPVAWLVTAICAPTTDPPLGSNTVPESPPVPAVWAKQHFNWGRAPINMRIATDRMAMDKALVRIFILITSSHKEKSRAANSGRDRLTRALRSRHCWIGTNGDRHDLPLRFGVAIPA